MSAAPKPDPERRAVRVLSHGTVSSGFLLRDPVLDRDGTTISVIGCKSGIAGRKTSDTVLVALGGGHLLPARITHIHATHDRFRAAVTASRLPEDLDLGLVSLDPPRPATAAEVDVVYLTATRAGEQPPPGGAP